MDTRLTVPASGCGEVAALEAAIVQIAARIMRESSWPNTLPANDRHLIGEVLRVAVLLWVRPMPGIH